MTDLRDETCVPFDEMTDPLTPEEFKRLSDCVPGWQQINVEGEKRLRRTFRFHDFPDAVEFVRKVAEQCKQQDRPRIIIDWSRVTIECWSRALRGVYGTDFTLALHIDDLFVRWELTGGHKDVVQQASEESFPASDPPAW